MSFMPSLLFSGKSIKNSSPLFRKLIFSVVTALSLFLLLITHVVQHKTCEYSSELLDLSCGKMGSQFCRRKFQIRWRNKNESTAGPPVDDRQMLSLAKVTFTNPSWTQLETDGMDFLTGKFLLLLVIVCATCGIISRVISPKCSILLQ